MLQPAEIKVGSLKAIEIDLTSSNGEAEEEEEELVDDIVVDDEVDDDADVDEDEDDDDEEEVGSDCKNHAVSLWCQALAGNFFFYSPMHIFFK